MLLDSLGQIFRKWQSVCSRLDCFLFFYRFPRHKTGGASKTIFYHCPIVIESCPFKWEPYPFKFENTWLEHHSFKNNFEIWRNSRRC